MSIVTGIVTGLGMYIALCQDSYSGKPNRRCGASVTVPVYSVDSRKHLFRFYTLCTIMFYI